MKNQRYVTCLFLMAYCLIAKSQTYSPYTPAQINEFNNQPLAPEETPAGPIYFDGQKPKPKSSLDADYFNQPIGEEEAESQETESATPFVPTPATFTF